MASSTAANGAKKLHLSWKTGLSATMARATPAMSRL